MKHIALSLIFAVLPMLAAAQQQTGFCGNYIQIASNAGACPDCSLLIADNPEILKYFVEANNGWSAELDWDSTAGTFARGTGKWNDGGAFEVEMEAQGFFLKMWMSPRSVDSNWVTAVYACLD